MQMPPSVVLKVSQTCFKNANIWVISGSGFSFTRFLSFPAGSTSRNEKQEGMGTLRVGWPRVQSSPLQPPARVGACPRTPVPLPLPGAQQGRDWRLPLSLPRWDPHCSLHGVMAAAFWGRCFSPVRLCRFDSDSSLSLKMQPRGSPRVTQSLSRVAGGPGEAAAATTAPRGARS